MIARVSYLIIMFAALVKCLAHVVWPTPESARTGWLIALLFGSASVIKQFALWSKERG